MFPAKLILLWLYIFVLCLCLESVKIGVSKPLATTSTTTTLIPPTTSAEVNGLENSTDSSSETVDPLGNTTTAPISLTTEELEWPEFPPKRKTTTKATTTKKPKTTTEKPKTSTSTATPTTENVDANKNETQSPLDTLALSVYLGSKTLKYCFCDITLGGCDINCCCDPDCAPGALKVFKCLTQQTHDFELHEGRFEDFKFQHGLPSCEVNDGWLCVFRTNLPAASEKVPPNYSDTSRYHTWPNMLKGSEETETRDYFVYGDSLKIVNMETKDISNFDLPGSLDPPQCQGKEPLIHLKSTKFHCLFSNKEQVDEVQQKFIEFPENHKILIRPSNTDEFQNAKSFQNIVANITLRRCSELNGGKCLKKFYDNVEVDNETGDVLKKVQLHVFHNFTNVLGLLIDLWFDNVEEDSSEVWLEYEILFHNKTLKNLNLKKNLNAFKEISKITSGPLGYQLGKPLIITKYLPANENLTLSEKNQILAYFSESTKNELNILQVFQKQNGLCRGSNLSPEEGINYGINLVKQCKILLDNATLNSEDEPSKTNFTTVCQKLQNVTQHLLWGSDLSSLDSTTYYVSQLGKPQNESRKWLPLNIIGSDFIPVHGQYLQNSHSFVCRNILLSLNYEFHIGSYDLAEAMEQNLLKHARLVVGERHDLEFALDEVMEVPLALTVRFYDINEISGAASKHWVTWCAGYLISLVLVLCIM